MRHYWGDHKFCATLENVTGLGKSRDSCDISKVQEAISGAVACSEKIPRVGQVIYVIK
jgi:hypothetical protein